MKYGCRDDWYNFKYMNLPLLDDLGDGVDYFFLINISDSLASLFFYDSSDD